ncbi:MAG TPA: NAD-dependent epimerase/dehydratase family protein [Pyrinomonadaceae bacterium]|nr:NAD-dependent epimerase/dehydratase family protein [Pyrinomonadaceae bacterium]
MKILIIGGTKFLGRHLVTAAQSRGHELTLFNRGRHSQESFENVEQIYGDRNHDLDKLTGETWDAVIDTCGYLPETVEASARALKDAVNQYVFVSSISAYASFPETDFDEAAPVAELNDEQKKRIAAIDPSGNLTGPTLGEIYGGLKVLCERAAENAMPGRVLHVRSGLIVGSFDPTDRFTYWAMRVAAGGEVLAPGTPNRFMQLIDARDLSEWIIEMVERNENGIYHATGKPLDLTMAKMLEEIKRTSGSDAEFTWVDERFLKRENVEQWSEMPLYLEESDKEARGFLSANVDKAVAKNLKFRPLSETINETIRWRKANSDAMRAGITPERARELLQKWHGGN